MGSLFPVWAEESGDTDSGLTEWAFGNGNDTPVGTGVVLPFAAELFALSLAHEASATASVDAVVGSQVMADYRIQTLNSKTAYVVFSEPLIVPAGSAVNFKTSQGDARSNGSVVCAWFRTL